MGSELPHQQRRDYDMLWNKCCSITDPIYSLIRKVMESEIPHQQRRSDYDMLGNKCCLITGSIYIFIRKGYEFLGKHKRCALPVIFFVFEAISVAVDQLGKTKWGYHLTAVTLSAFCLLITVYPFVKKRTIIATKSMAERQLLAVEIVFSAIQLMATMIHYTFTVWGVKKNYNALVFPLAFAAIAIIFVFLKDEGVTNSSHDQIHNNSAPRDSHPINISLPIDSVAGSTDSKNQNQRENMRSMQHSQLQNNEIYRNSIIDEDLQYQHNKVGKSSTRMRNENSIVKNLAGGNDDDQHLHLRK